MESIAPQWLVDSVPETVKFYTEKLGFVTGFQGSMFAILCKGGVSLMIRELKKPALKRPNRIPFIESGWHSDGSEAWDAYIWVNNADEVYELMKENNVSIIREIQNTNYGNRDFEIEDNNGYILCFGQIL